MERELRAQIERARRMGIRITHLDPHMATLWWTPEFFEIYARLGRAYGLPVRTPPQDWNLSPDLVIREQLILIDRGLMIGSRVEPENWLKTYKEMLEPLPPGIYELVVHLGYDDDEMQGATRDHPDFGAAWRQRDFDLVGNPEFQSFLREQGFILITWGELARALPAGYHRAKWPRE